MEFMEDVKKLIQGLASDYIKNKSETLHTWLIEKELLSYVVVTVIIGFLLCSFYFIYQKYQSYQEKKRQERDLVYKEIMQYVSFCKKELNEYYEAKKTCQEFYEGTWNPLNDEASKGRNRYDQVLESLRHDGVNSLGISEEHKEACKILRSYRATYKDNNAKINKKHLAEIRKIESKMKAKMKNIPEYEIAHSYGGE